MSELRRPKGATKQAKRLGRGPGSGNGTTAGKGTKGQNARSGGGVRPGFEGGQMPLYRRIARRGFSNYPFRMKYAEVDVSALERAFSAGETVTLEGLAEKGLMGRRDVSAKILGSGKITIKLTIDGPKVTAGARRKIEAAGGSVLTAQDNGTNTADSGPEQAADSENTTAEAAKDE